MALTFIPGQSRTAALGQAFGTGLGGLLNQLAQNKAQQLQQYNQLQAFQRSGLTPQDAQLVSLFSSQPELQAKLLGSLFERGPGTLEQPGQTPELMAAQEMPTTIGQQPMAPTGGLELLSQLQPGMLGGGLQALMPQLQQQAGAQPAGIPSAPQAAQQAQQQQLSSFYRPTRREAREEEKLSLKKQQISEKQLKRS